MSSEISASSVEGFYVCSSRLSGTSKNDLKLIHQVYWCSDIRKCLNTRIQHFLNCGVMVIHCKLSHIRKCLNSGASCSSDRSRCVLSFIYSCMFCPSVSVGSPAAESVFTVFHLGKTENDVYHLSLRNALSSCSSIVNVLSFFSYWEFSRLLIAERILEWNQRDGCLSMWRRFSSIKVCIVDLLHYREL